jgi:argininosuccinate synthase
MKIVLAYSGGLDTSVALKWLADTYKAQVIAFCADIGQKEDLKAVAEKARRTGASKVFVEDLREYFLTEYAFRSLAAGAKYEGDYLLAAPLSRPLIAERAIKVALAEDADAVAHGATGKGNDQVRFYSSFVALAPELKVLAPVIDWEMKSRDDEIQYAIKHNIPISQKEGPDYSIDTNIWGSSIECGPLDDVAQAPPEEVYQLTQPPSKTGLSPEEVSIGFKAGRPVSLNGHELPPVALVTRLNELASRHGVGRIDIIENRVVGIKTRGIYECPAGTVLHLAHRELEKLVLDRDTFHLKTTLGDRYATLIYDGLWFSPLRYALDQFVDYTQRRVTGTITVQLANGQVIVRTRRSPFALYSNSLSTYGAGDTFNHSAGRGFAYVKGLPLSLWFQQEESEKDVVEQGEWKKAI